jgi:hypothetical protein
MTDLFQCKETMPPVKETVSVAMVREETPLGTPVLSGEWKRPNLAVENTTRPRKGHAY